MLIPSMHDPEPSLSFEARAIKDTRDAYGITAVVAFGLATELSSVSGKLALGSALCLSVAGLLEVVGRAVNAVQNPKC